MKNNGKKGKFISDDGVTIELTIDEDNASENIFIVEKDGKLIQEKKEKNVLVFSSDKEKPLVYIDGKLSDNDGLESTNPNSIKSVSVLKDKAAIEKYGEKGKNGVILITTKENKKSATLFNSDKEEPIIYIDGELSKNEVLKKLDPDSIEKMEVLKGEKAIEEYGEKAKNGVILITLKKK